MPHEIRLAGPWEFSTDGRRWKRCVLPFPHNDTCVTGAVRLRRKFHRPSGLETASVVQIVAMTDSHTLQLQLNEVIVRTSECQPVDGSNVCTFDVSEILNEFNTVELIRPSDAPESPFNVRAVKLRITEPGD